MMNNIQPTLNIKQLDDHQRRSRTVFPFAQSIIEGYINLEKKASTIIKAIAFLPIATVGITLIFRKINQRQDSFLRTLKRNAIKNEEDYNNLLKLYQTKQKFVKALDSTSTISPDDYDQFYKTVPFLLKPILGPVIKSMKTSLEIYKALGEKLCLTPKNVTDQQLKEAAVDNEGIEDWFDDDDDDYIGYAQKLSLRQSGCEE